MVGEAWLPGQGHREDLLIQLMCKMPVPVHAIQAAATGAASMGWFILPKFMEADRRSTQRGPESNLRSVRRRGRLTRQKPLPILQIQDKIPVPGQNGSCRVRLQRGKDTAQ